MRGEAFAGKGRLCVMRVVLALLIGVLGSNTSRAFEWHFEVVDGTWGVSYSSLALDRENRPHISYFVAGTRDLKYAWRGDAGWIVETVDTEGDVGSYGSLALDEAGYPHISYHDGDNSDLKYAYKDSSGWHIEVAVSDGWVGEFTSIALTDAGTPCISCTRLNAGHGLEYAYRSESGWRHETIDSLENFCPYTSLALDDEGRAHLSYMAVTNSTELRYAVRSESGWVVTTVDSTGLPGHHSSLALDRLGFPHISHFSPSGSRVELASRDSSGWHTETAGYGQAYDTYSSLCLDADDRPYIGYYRDRACVLMLSFKDESGWHTETVDDGGSYLSLALDDAGAPRLSYMGAGGLRYAYAEPVGVPEWARRDGTLVFRVCPNPARSTISVQCHSDGGLHGAGGCAYLKVFDCLGRLVAAPLNDMRLDGTGASRWDLTTCRGDRVQSGVYFLILQDDAGQSAALERLVVLE